MTQILVLPFATPPLRQNDRLHWAKKAKLTREIRAGTGCLAVVQLRPITGPVIITFVWQVTDNRRRDADGPAPTAKAAIDGLVDAGILADDRSTLVVETRYRIVKGDTPQVRLEILPVVL